MGLKVEMKPGERIIIGESLLTNGDKSTSFIVEGTAPILREKDVLTPELARYALQENLSCGSDDVFVQVMCRNIKTTILNLCLILLRQRLRFCP
jgi:hypothetical protein